MAGNLFGSSWLLIVVFWAGGCAGILVASLMHMSHGDVGDDRRD
jgi:hypothetical protein